MIFSLHHVIDSLAGMLTGAYPDYPVYDSPNQQGTSFPCFFLFFIPSTIEEHVGNHYFRDLGVDLVFVQQRNLVTETGRSMRSRSFWTGIWIRSHTQTAAERVFRFQCRISSGVLKMKSCTTSSISGRGSWWKKRKT